MNAVIQLRPSQSEKPTVRRGRTKNTDYRQREYLTEAEIDKLMATAGDSRNPVRDRLLILIAFRHALRVSELVDIRWQQIHLDTATIDIPGPRTARPAFTACKVTNCAYCGHFGASTPMQTSCSCRNARRHFRSTAPRS
jgi:integrase